MNQPTSEASQFIEGNENYTVQGNGSKVAQGNESKVVQGNDNHVNNSTEKIDVTINVIKQSPINHPEVHQDNHSNHSNETRSLKLEKESTEIHFLISGTLKNKKSKVTLKQFEKHLQKIANDLLLTIDDVEEGSLKFILKGSQEGLEQLERLFNTGELTELLGVPVENVDFVESNREKLELTIAGEISQTDLAKLKATVTGVDERKLLVHKIRNNQSNKKLNLTGANLTGANLTEADLSQADLTGANLAKADLSQADLTGANLTKAKFTQADLFSANLFFANFSEADLSEACLAESCFEGANLFFANLSGADLTGADLSGVDFSSSQVINTKFSSNSLGITAELKQNLIKRGAIFEDSLEDPLV
ncbi:MAG: pentapeptide repeat-containing protein [Cyanobacteria bacterium J06592_8]